MGVSKLVRGLLLASLLASTQISAQSDNITGAISILLLDDPKYREVTSATGRVWLDRNLGASRAGLNASDAKAFGDLYQWGRLNDGHQSRTSATTNSLSGANSPGHNEFITANFPYDWRSPQNPNLWQGTVGINNPCPTGFKLPTGAELLQEKNSWPTPDAAGAFASPLKWVMAGFRNHYVGGLENAGTSGHYWSSTAIVFAGSPNSYRSESLEFYSALAGIHTNVNAAGRSVRCIKALVMLP